MRFKRKKKSDLPEKMRLDGRKVAKSSQNGKKTPLIN